MRKAIIFCIAVLALCGCATTHYLPSECPKCPTMEPPPEVTAPKWVKITFIDKDGNKVVYYALPESEVTTEKIAIEVTKEYCVRAWELNK